MDSLQLTADYSVATPVNWKDGDDCIVVPALSDDEAKEKFPKGFETIKCIPCYVWCLMPCLCHCQTEFGHARHAYSSLDMEHSL